MNEFWIILTGSLAAVSCALIGCFLVLRKNAMLADAISHSVLPGIVIAYLIAGTRDSVWLLFGAAATGVLSTFFIEILTKQGRLQSDASVGIVFTWLFALGVILISLFAGQTDLDQDCVLYGEIAYVPLDTITDGSGNNWGPRQIWILGALLLFVLLFIKIGFKGLTLTTFDPAFAAASGISVAAWHYALMSLVSLTTVFTFESVGAVLVVAMITAPAASAYLITRKLKNMLLLAAFFGILSSFGGYYSAYYLNASVSGCMATCGGFIFLICFVLSRYKSSVFSKLEPEINQ